MKIVRAELHVMVKMLFAESKLMAKQFKCSNLDESWAESNGKIIVIVC